MIDALINAAVTEAARLNGILFVAAYDGQIAEERMAELLVKTPAVFVAADVARATKERAKWRWDLRLNLLVVTRNLATREAAALGGPTGPAASAGAYLLAEALAAAFTDATLGLEIDPIQPAEIRNLVPGWARGQKAAVVGVELTTAFWSEKLADPAALDDFLRAQSRLAVGDASDPYTDLAETRSDAHG